MKRFENKIALVTGAANSIRRASAERLATEGARVIAVDLNQPEGLAGNVLAVSLDVRSESAWQALIGQIADQHGHLHALVNCAGILRSAPIQETTLADWQDIIDTNLTGSFLAAKHASSLMSASGGAAIVNMASINALRSLPTDGGRGIRP